jgi:hypothetical protein
MATDIFPFSKSFEASGPLSMVSKTETIPMLVPWGIPSISGLNGRVGAGSRSVARDRDQESDTDVGRTSSNEQKCPDANSDDTAVPGAVRLKTGQRQTFMKLRS